MVRLGFAIIGKWRLCLWFFIHVASAFHQLQTVSSIEINLIVTFDSRKSVAHLPWRAFGYKAFNTFIDDVFAFIIKMPTSHRIACLRDDVVFFCYLYQVFYVSNSRYTAELIQ